MVAKNNQAGFPAYAGMIALAMMMVPCVASDTAKAGDGHTTPTGPAINTSVWEDGARSSGLGRLLSWVSGK